MRPALRKGKPSILAALAVDGILPLPLRTLHVLALRREAPGVSLPLVFREIRKLSMAEGASEREAEIRSQRLGMVLILQLTPAWICRPNSLSP